MIINKLIFYVVLIFKIVLIYVEKRNKKYVNTIKKKNYICVCVCVYICIYIRKMIN